MINLKWFCSKPTPYNDYLFKSIELDKRFSLKVYYQTGILSSHPWKNFSAEGYSSIYFKIKMGIDWSVMYKTIKNIKTSDNVMVTGWNGLTVSIILLFYSFLGGKFILITDTPDLSKKRNILKSLMRQLWLKWLFYRAYKVFGTGIKAIEVLKIMGAGENKLVNFPYWINNSLYGKNNIDNHHTNLFLSSGRIINNIKGHDLAIKAFAKIKNIDQRFIFEYRIAGVGKDIKRLKALAIKLNIENNIKFLGWLEQDELVDEMSKATYYIHPSPVLEPYGVAVLEAMASRMIVLTSDLTGAGLDRIEHEINGFLHSAGNIDQLASQIIYASKLDKKVLTNMRLEAWNTANQWPVRRALEILNAV